MDHDEELRLDVLQDLQREPMCVYEIWYAANTLFPDLLMRERIAAAERVFAHLVEAGSVTLWRGRTQSDRTAVSERDVDELLRLFSTWAPEAGEHVVWMELVEQ